MSLDPRVALGRWRVAEGALEATVPTLAAAAGWVGAAYTLAAPTAARPLTVAELYALLGLVAALSGWMAGRQLWLAGRKNPLGQAALAVLYVCIGYIALPWFSMDHFTSVCGELGGEVLRTTPIGEGAGQTVCRLGGVPDNAYLPGALLRPSWEGAPGPGLWAWGVMHAVLGALALRDRRLRPTALPNRLFELLRFAPARGHKAAFGGASEGKVVACENPTLWGEPCGQLYPADRVFGPGEACVRCGASFRRAERELTFKVVSLFSADPDVLNGVEKTDTVSWRRDEPMTPDARPSGLERWVQLGTLRLPDVVSAATALSIVHDLLPQWAGANERTREAANLAIRRASRVSAWIWFGSFAHRLTYARPGENAALALGSTRLRDLVPEGGEELWLQLDVGLFPLQLFYGFRRDPTDEARPAELQNSKADLWVPVAPSELPKDQRGLWVPRVEGEALRAWLSTERLRAGPTPGMSTPLPFLFGRGDGEDPFATRSPHPGSLDFVRMPLDKDGSQPSFSRSVGDSIAEWDWLEANQIQLLRQQSLVLISRDMGGRA